jgi:probable H4MPT-linked C1 transfer pathway protein
MSRSTDEHRNDWIGLDIGGANIKAAHTDGTARTVPFEVWKRPDGLTAAIESIAASLPPSSCVALTMTAELCDCYPTKRAGVRDILDAVTRAFPDRSIAVWGMDGSFHSVAEIRDDPILAAAANWLALAQLAARLVPGDSAVLIDVGSTTTDLIPMALGRVVARGRNDTERLQTGELVYAGVRRTPILALATDLPVRGVPTGLAAELFASTLDAYLILGDIGPDPMDLSTCDGRPATAAAAHDRLARMIGADRESFSTEDALEFAGAADRLLTDRLVRSAERACLATIGRPRAAIIAGSGEFLALRVAERLLDSGSRLISLNDAWGPIASAAACAFAIVQLAAERPEGHPGPDVPAPMSALASETAP